MPVALSASMEDYLEAILRIVEGDAHAHVKDIAAALDVKMPSVTGALHTLAERKLVNYRPYGTVTLTARGRRIAEKVRRSHEVLSTFFRDVLGLGAAAADDTACKIEHSISDVALKRLTKYLEIVKECPVSESQRRKAFGGAGKKESVS